MPHPRAKHKYTRIDRLEPDCPWCGQQAWPQGRNSGSKEMTPGSILCRIWLDKRGRVWHAACADVALGEYGHGIVEKTP